MSDTKESMPAQPKTTVQLEAPPAWAIEMSQRMADGFRSLAARLDAVEQNVSILVDDKKQTNERIFRLENWRDNEVNARLNATSERVRGESEVNLKQDAAIGSVLAKAGELEKKLDEIAAKPDTAAVVLEEVRKLSDKPWAKRLGQAVLGVVLLAISAIGIKLQMAVTKLEEKPAQVQPAPTVYLPAPTDGGAR